MRHAIQERCVTIATARPRNRSELNPSFRPRFLFPAVFSSGPEEFDGWIAVFPNITIDGQVFPQYVKPSRARRDDTSDTSPIKQFHSAGDKWVAPTEAGMSRQS